MRGQNGALKIIIGRPNASLESGSAASSVGDTLEPKP